MSANNYHPSVARVKGNATTHLKAPEAAGRVPFIDYKLPRADHDIANTRNSFRKRDNTVTDARPAGEAQTIKLKIPDCVKTMVPGETAIRISVKLINFDSLTFMDGSIQRMFRRIIIRDGHGVELENIERYNRVYQTLFDVHVPESIKYTAFQQEGVYEYEVPSMLVGPRAAWTGVFNSSDWNANIHPGPDNRTISSINNFSAAANNSLEPNFLTDFSRYMAWRHTYNQEYGNPGFNVERQQAHWSASSSNAVTGYTRTINTICENIFNPQSTGVVGRRGISLYADPATIPQLDAPAEDAKSHVMYHGHHCYTPWYYHIGQKYYQTNSATNDKGPGHVSNEITFVFHPTASGVLSSTKHIPLWITKGLEIELEIDRPSNYLRDARPEHDNLAPSWDLLSDSDRPRIEVTRAEVLWTGVDLTEKMINSINKQYETSGLHFCFPSFMCEEREDIADLNNLTTHKIEFKNRFAMLNRVYSNVSASRGANGSEWVVDTFNTLSRQPTVRSWEYNRIYRPDWGTDLNVEDIDHFYQCKRSLGTLQNYRSNDMIYGNFHERPTDGKKKTNYYIDEFETEPSGFLTGIDTNNEKMVYRFRPSNDAVAGERFFFTWHFYKLAVYRRGEPVIVKS